ncbi:MAG: hypothetical protein ACPGNV_06325 [Mangrovicoccus sp.]
MKLKALILTTALTAGSVAVAADMTETKKQTQFDKDVAEGVQAIGEDANKAWEGTKDVAESAKDAAGDVYQATKGAVVSAYTETREWWNDTMIDDGYEVVEVGMATKEDLMGARVFDAKDNWIGEISEVAVDDDSMMDYSHVDVGGFIGIGEKTVRVEPAQLVVTQNIDTGEFQVHTAMTKEELKDLPEVDA